MNCYLDHLEWDFFSGHESFRDLKSQKGIVAIPLNSEIIIRRDENYKLSAFIQGTYENIEEVKRPAEEELNSFPEGDEIAGEEASGTFLYTIENCIAVTYQSAMLPDEKIVFTKELFFDKIRKENKALLKEKITTHFDWYLCRNFSLFYPNSTTRAKQASQITRARIGIDAVPEKSGITGDWTSYASDYFLVRTDQFSFIIAKVPKHFGPEWANKLSIEYRESLGGIPDPETRKAISELAGFILGTPMFHVGSTSLKDSEVISSFAKSPRETGIQYTCKQPAFPPIFMQRLEDRKKPAELISTLLPTYLEKRNEYKLDLVVAKYWLGLTNPIGINLPIFSSIIETLANAFAKAEGFVNYFTRDEFERLLSGELRAIEQKLSPYPFSNKILNKIKGAYQRGINEKIEFLVDAIGLNISKVEEEALKSRNAMAHDSVIIEGKNEAQKWIRKSRAYQTLLNRVLLKLLGYSEHYIDYYTIGQPIRMIEQSIP